MMTMLTNSHGQLVSISIHHIFAESCSILFHIWYTLKLVLRPCSSLLCLSEFAIFWPIVDSRLPIVLMIAERWGDRQAWKTGSPYQRCNWVFLSEMWPSSNWVSLSDPSASWSHPCGHIGLIFTREKFYAKKMKSESEFWRPGPPIAVINW